MMDKTTDEIFCDLMDLATELRSDALAEISGLSDEQKQTIRNLLADAVQAEAYFSGTSVAVKMLPFSTHVEGVGDLCGPYKLLRKLGEGGFGMVWLAEQSVPLRRTVAVKVIKAGMDSVEVLARFEAEKQALARMDHPHIAKVLDAGVTELGRPYFVMELVEGKSITRYCRDHEVGIKQRLEFFTSVCEAVGHAHQKGIIHRDIKPSNVIITETGDQPTVKVIDFGIAKAIEGNLTDHTLRTREGQWIGTPAYMSPEQAGLASGDVDTRSDIYALGVLLYELIAGVAPFDPQALMQAGYEEMRRIIREVEPPRPSERIATAMRDATKTNPASKMTSHQSVKGISSELDWIVIKAMEKTKERRYDSAAALAGDISRYLADEPVEARPPSSFYLLAKFARRHRQAVITVIFLFVVLLLALGFSLWQAEEAREARDLARERLTDAVHERNAKDVALQDAVRERNAKDTALQDAVNERNAKDTALQEAVRERNAKDVALQDAEAVSGLFSEVIRRPSPEIDGRSVTMVSALDAALQKLDEGYVTQPKRHAMLLQVLAETYEKLGLMEKSVEIRQKAFNLLKSLGETSLQETIPAGLSLIQSLSYVGRYREAAERGGEVLPLSIMAYGPNNPTALGILSAQAKDTFCAGEHLKAIELEEQLIQMNHEAYPDDPIKALVHYSIMNQFCQDSGLALHKIKPIPRFPPQKPPQESTAPRIIMPTAVTLEELQKRVGQLDHDLGKTHTETIVARSELVLKLSEMERHQEAIAMQFEVVEQCKARYGETHPKTLEATKQCIGICNRSSEWDLSKKMREQAVHILKETKAPDYYQTLHFNGDRIFALLLVNRAEEGIQLAEQVLPEIRQVMGPCSRYYYHYACYYARCLGAVGRAKEALDYLSVSCPNMSDDTFVNHFYATLLLWSGQEKEYEVLRTRMLNFWRPKIETETQFTYQLERNAFLCSMLPMKSEEQTQEIAATLDKVEAIFKSPNYRKHQLHGPSWSRTMHGILHCRLGHYERALQCFDEAEQMALATGLKKWDDPLTSIYRPIALHGVGRVKEAKKLFLEKAEKPVLKGLIRKICGGITIHLFTFLVTTIAASLVAAMGMVRKTYPPASPGGRDICANLRVVFLSDLAFGFFPG